MKTSALVVAVAWLPRPAVIAMRTMPYCSRARSMTWAAGPRCMAAMTQRRPVLAVSSTTTTAQGTAVHMDNITSRTLRPTMGRRSGTEGYEGRSVCDEWTFGRKCGGIDVGYEYPKLVGPAFVSWT